MWQLINYQGKLGITLGWSCDNEQPIRRRTVWVHPRQEWDEHYFSQFTQIYLVTNNHFRAFSCWTYSESYLDTEGWSRVEESEEIKPPGRGGKDWYWEWFWGRYVKRFR